MKTCAVCNAEFNDGIQCGSCKKYLDLGCANISKAIQQRMELCASRMAQWKCPTCQTSSPPPSIPDPASLHTEITNLKRKLQNLASEGTSGRLDEFDTRLAEVERKTSEFQETYHCLAADLASIKNKLEINEQEARLNEIEIKGVPMREGENLFAIVEAIGDKVKFNIYKNEIKYIRRMHSFNPNEKLIIVSFLSRYVKEDFIAAARAFKNLSTSHIGFQGTSQRVYVNEHLSVECKKLLTKVKVMAKEKLYDFVWVKHGEIRVSKKGNSNQAIIIRNESDLIKIV